MPSLQLLISDPALRQAVLEQVAQAGFTLVPEEAEMSAPGTALIFDENMLDKKAQKFLQESKDKHPVFLLGEARDENLVPLITETFPKPLRLGHLVARLQFHFEAAPRLRGTSIQFGPYRLNSQMRQITNADTGDIVRLTEKETALLEYLGQATEPVPREELLAAVWGYDGRIDTHTLETHIYQLRRKLDVEDWLINEKGAYRLNRA